MFARFSGLALVSDTESPMKTETFSQSEELIVEDITFRIQSCRRKKRISLRPFKTLLIQKSLVFLSVVISMPYHNSCAFSILSRAVLWPIGRNFVFDHVNYRSHLFAKTEGQLRGVRGLATKKMKQNNKSGVEGKKKLHKAAKFKRIISALDERFSKNNLPNNCALLEELNKTKGLLPVSSILEFEPLKHWTDAGIVIKALESTGGQGKYEVIYSKALKEGYHFNSTLASDEHDAVGLIEDEMDAHLNEQLIPDDWSGDTRDERYAFVRHRKWPLEKIQELYAESSSSLNGLDFDDDHDDNDVENLDHWHMGYEWPHHDDDYQDFCFEDFDLDLESEKQQSKLPAYKSKREVHIIDDPKQLDSFCKTLLASVKTFVSENNENVRACAVGFDVEYCTLDLDIRGNLPAMIQLSCPNPDGIVGLIWLDKFPYHGQGVAMDQKCKSLMDLLANPLLLKVGVGTTADVMNLAAWWGINSDEYEKYFACFVNLSDTTTDTKTETRSLRDWVSLTLQQSLPKRKATRSKKKTKGKAKTAHWRSDTLSNQMKTYAVNDVASGIDVFNKLNGFG